MATLTYALNRYKWGNLERSKPSRFLREIGQNFLEYPQTGGKPFRGVNQNRFTSTSFREETQTYSAVSQPPEMKKVVKANTGSPSTSWGIETSSFSEGDTVLHERFGNGVIITIDGQPPNTTALVEFENYGRKKLLLRFAKLRKI